MYFTSSAHDAALRHDHGQVDNLEFEKVAGGGAVFNHEVVVASVIGFAHGGLHAHLGGHTHHHHRLVIDRFKVPCSEMTALATSLSVGNLQKFIVDREIMLAPKGMVLSREILTRMA